MDILIKNTNIIDGLGKPGFIGDIGIKDKKIVLVGKSNVNLEADMVIDGTGLVTCPGFIDSHTHADLSIHEDSGAENFIMQGVTSVVGGHCGISVSPAGDEDFFNSYMSMLNIKIKREWNTFAEWLAFLEAKKTAVNYIPLVGHNLLRGAVLGKNCRRISETKEIEAIKNILNESLDAGAFGMSAGLDGGTAGHYANEIEIMELLNIIRKNNVLFSPHTKHHQNQWPSDNKKSAYGLYVGPKGEVMCGRYHGLMEVLEYARRAEGVRMMISHLTPIYMVPQPHPSYLDEAIARASLEEIIEKPRKEGMDISFNVVAADYSIASELPMIKSFFNQALARPEWLNALDKAGFTKGLHSKPFREKLKKFVNSGKFKFGMLSPATDPYWSACYRVISCENKKYAGKTVFEMALGRSSRSIVETIYNEAIEVVCDILMECPDTTWALINDKREAGAYAEFLKHPFGMPCSDSVSFPENPVGKGNILDIGVPPCAYNMMPAFLLEMVKRRKSLSIAEAVKRLTSLPAEILGIKDRGVLKEGNWADVVILDWDKLEVWHDFTRPERKPAGIQNVIVNGRIAYQNGSMKASHNGMVLRKNKS